MREWKLVPVEPTGEMIEAVHAVVSLNRGYRNGLIPDMHKAMLAAAPAASPPTLEARAQARTARLQRERREPLQGLPAAPADVAGLVKTMVDRFLAWKLPKDFYPDAGISFQRDVNGGPRPESWWPVGTNLFTADQAKTMIEHMLGDALTSIAAAPTALVPVINALFETKDKNVCGTTNAPIKRVECQDDGSFTVVIDYWPGVPAAPARDSVCHYSTEAGHVCNKCGRIHDVPAAPAEDVVGQCRFPLCQTEEYQQKLADQLLDIECIDKEALIAQNTRLAAERDAARAEAAELRELLRDARTYFTDTMRMSVRIDAALAHTKEPK